MSFLKRSNHLIASMIHFTFVPLLDSGFVNSNEYNHWQALMNADILPPTDTRNTCKLEIKENEKQASI